MSTTVFQDQHHVDLLRERLWVGREYGQVAVMVGAGFSRNADPNMAGALMFPSWSTLAQHLFDALHTDEAVSSDERTIKMVSLGALRLASEYETTFGRTALDDLLQRVIPDGMYSPGNLHKLLLSLPWSDVFTTNYDTLLERAQSVVIDRKYDLIHTSSDIVGRMKPRIVKLHGSFPSHRPFIVTEEDYRTYPRKFAPFVNTVQQSVMENALCLIGFSGDDPNFVHWTGWVRDNLGQSTPPIYLCGLLDLSSSQRRYLEEQKKIIPIDLSPLFPASEYPSHIRHAKALEWFLLNLMNGEPPNYLHWPTATKSCAWKQSEDLPEIPSGPKTFTDPGSPTPPLPPGSVTNDQLFDLCDTWRKIRIEYPGWVVTPKRNRAELWRYTKRWIEIVLHRSIDLAEPHDLYLLYELNWRLDRTLTPLFAEWVEKIELVLEQYNPFPDRLEVKTASIRPDVEQYKDLDWKRIGDCWIGLAFGVMKAARDGQDEEYFHKWADILDSVLERYPEQKSRWYYEKCLYHIYRLDQDSVRTTVNQWPSISNMPFWDVRRASLLAELGERDEAEKLAETALSRIRSQLSPYAVDYNLLSQEGWCMFLLRAIKRNQWGKHNEIETIYRDRWSKLEAYRCNPMSEFEQLETIVRGPRPRRIPETETRRGFDTNRQTISFHLVSGITISDFLQPFRFLRLFEEGGIPIRCGIVSMYPEAVLAAVDRIFSSVPLWAFGSLVRSGKVKETAERFSRLRVASLNQNHIEELTKLLMDALDNAITRLDGGILHQFSHTDFSTRIVGLSLELLSRLSFRFSENDMRRLFSLAIEAYHRPLFRGNVSLHKPIGVLFERILDTVNESLLREMMPALLSLPIPPENGFAVAQPQLWGEPFASFDATSRVGLYQDIDRTPLDIPIASLLHMVRSQNVETRRRSTLRLAKLYDMNALTKEEQAGFGEALWSQLDEGTGLPMNTDLTNSSFLILPQSAPPTAKTRFRELMLSRDFSRVVHHSVNDAGKEVRQISGGFFPDPLVGELMRGTRPLIGIIDVRLIDWTSAEALELFEKALRLWDEEKMELVEPDSVMMISDAVRRRFQDLMRPLSEIILPRLVGVPQQIQKKIERLLTEMEEYGILAAPALPALLMHDSARSDTVAQKLRTALNSMDEKAVDSAVRGVLIWYNYHNKGLTPQPPADFLDEVVNRAKSRRQPGLEAIIGNLYTIVRWMPELLTVKHQESLLVAFEYLAVETELPVGLDIGSTSEYAAPIPIEDRPGYRVIAAELARAFAAQYADADTLPSSLARWRDICQTDVLPEVRQAWRQRNKLE